jgi:methionyl-tRNA formyltransferase
MKIVCVGYRKWALEIYERLKIFYGTSHDIVIFDKDNYSETSLTQENPDMVLFYGWSWKISPSIIEKYMCLMLHPSPLPKYRGGSPIQNQIINGETQSAVTIIEMTDKLDAGDILAQESISLDGNIKEILKRLTRVGTRLTKRIVSGNITRRKQDETEATFYNRRKEKDNEITVREILSQDSQYLYNKIRMLGDPYPYAYIKTVDGKKLLIKDVSIEVGDD